MPYIDNEDRKKFREHIIKLANLAENKGELTYIISEFIGMWIVQRALYSRSALSVATSAVHNAEIELQRRLVGPYEMGRIEPEEDIESFDKILKALEFITGKEPKCSPIVKEVT